MERKENGVIEIDLLHIAGVLWKGVWMLVTVTVLGGVIGFALSTWFVAPKYKSTAYVYVNNQTLSFGSTSLSISNADITASQSLVETYIVILKTRKTLNEVISRANLTMSYEDLSRMVNATAVNSTEVFTITVTSNNPYEAELIVNTIADVLPEKIGEIVEGSSAKIVDYGVVDTRRVSPSRTRYTAIGMLIGFLVMGLVIVIFDMMNDLIRDEKYLERYKIPVLSVIPDLLGSSDIGKAYSRYGKYGKYAKQYGKSGKYAKAYGDKYAYDYGQKKTGGDKDYGYAYSGDNKAEGLEPGFAICGKMDFLASEAYKLLRTNLMYVIPSDETGGRVIGVTSSFRSEGKSVTSLNLAYTMSKMDKKVLLIEGDMRLPSLSKKIKGIKVKPGLSDVLAGLYAAKDVMQTTSKTGDLDIIAAGELPPNPGELLGSEKMKELMAELKQKYDWIVVDLPPADIVSDALALTASLSGILVVVRRDYTDRQSLNDCMNKLNLIKANTAGFVLTNSSVVTQPYKKYGRYGKRNRYGRYYRKYKKTYKDGYNRQNYSYAYESYGSVKETDTKDTGEVPDIGEQADSVKGEDHDKG